MPLLRFFLPFKYFITEVLPLLLVGLALASGGSVLEPAGVGSSGLRESFWQLLTEATPVAPLLPTPWHVNPVHPSYFEMWPSKGLVICCLVTSEF